MRSILLNPGPVTVSKSVKKALCHDDICHREKEFTDIINKIKEDLVLISRGGDDYEATLFCGSGTLAMEVILSSVVKQNDRILIISNGLYGDRFAEMAKIHNIDFFEHKSGWGKEIDLKAIEVLLRTRSFSHVFVIHHETTTGILNPIKEIGYLSKKYGCVYVVDAISSFGGIPFSIKDCKIDFLASVSNKCIQGIPGVCFVISKKSEIEKIRGYNRSYYLDLYDETINQRNKGQMRFTAPTMTIYSFKQALDELQEETVDRRYQRYCKSYKTLVDGLQMFKLYTKKSPSKLLTTFYQPDCFDFIYFHDKLYEKGYTIYPGLLKEKTIRIAVMGDIYNKDIEMFLKDAKSVICDMK